MKIWIVSDLHTESCPFEPAKIPDHDVLVIAGDIANGTIEAFIGLKELRQRIGRPIVFIPGNHDVFGDPLDVFDFFVLGGVHTLSSGQSIVIGNVRFVGATLWTDFELAGDRFASEAWAARHMPEYVHAFADDDDNDLWPAHTRAAHAQHRDAIEQVLAQPHAGPTVVVTHHAPSRQSIRGQVDVSDASYASNCEELMRRYRPELWVHGHVHQRCHYWVGDTQVICNPRGYANDDWDEWREETGFEEGLVIEV